MKEHPLTEDGYDKRAYAEAAQATDPGFRLTRLPRGHAFIEYQQGHDLVDAVLRTPPAPPASREILESRLAAIREYAHQHYTTPRDTDQEKRDESNQGTDPVEDRPRRIRRTV